MVKNILITGVAGFIGSNLAERLIKEGYHVIGVDNLSQGVKEQIPKEVKFYQEDIGSKNIYPLFKDIDVVFHLAAKNCISDCQKDPIETVDINITGAVNVFEAVKRTSVKKVIYAESSAIYEGTDLFPTSETEEKPISFYAKSKLADSMFAKAYNKFYGLNFVGLRYFNVYGPKQDYQRTIPPVMSAFIIKLLKGERPIIYGNGEKRRDFIYIDDVNDFHILAMNNEKVNNNIYNIGSGKNYSVNEIYNIIKNLIGVNIKPVYGESLPGEAEINLADISKAKSLGWHPRIDLEEGLKISINYIKNKVINNI